MDTCRIVDFFGEISIGSVQLEFNIFAAQWVIFVLHVLIDLIGICFHCASELKMKLCVGYLRRHHHAHV